MDNNIKTFIVQIDAGWVIHNVSMYEDLAAQYKSFYKWLYESSKPELKEENDDGCFRHYIEFLHKKDEQLMIENFVEYIKKDETK